MKPLINTITVYTINVLPEWAVLVHELEMFLIIISAIIMVYQEWR